MAARFAVGITGTKIWTNADTSIWSTTSGGASGASVPGVGDTVTLDAASGSGILQPNYDLSVTSLTMGAFTGTLDFSANNNSPTMQTFNCSGTGTRTLNMGSGTWTLTGNNATIWTTATTTGLTLTAGTSTVNCTYSGSVGTRVITTGGSAGLGLNNVNFSAGTDISGLSTGAFFCNNLNFSGFSGSLNNSAISVAGNFTLGTGMSVNSGSQQLNLTATTSVTFTSNGVAWPRPITMNGVGGTWTLQDDLNISSATQSLTLTNGTFNANNKNVTLGLFGSSNSNTRTLTMGSGTWTLTGSATTIWSMATTTGLTFTASTATINCNYSGATGTRSISTSTAFTASNPISFNITAGTDVISLNAACTNLDFTGFFGTWTNNSVDIYGNLKLFAGMSITASATSINLKAASGTATITSNGVNINKNLTVGVAASTATFSFSDALLLPSTNILTLTQGTFITNSSVTAGSFSSSNSNTRTITMGSGTWTITGTGTVWNTATTTGLTMNAGTSTIVINDASSSSKTIASGVTTLNNLTLSGAGTGTFIIGTTTGMSTFNNITVDTPPHTVQIFAGKTLVASSLTWSGTSGNLNTFQSTSAGTPWFVLVNSGTVSENYISLQDSAAAGVIPFYAGNHSVDAGGNTNWTFTTPPESNSENAARDQNHVPSLLGSDQADPTKTVQVRANPTTHALVVNDGTDGTDQGGSAAPRDQNYVPAFLAVSSVNGVTPVVVYMDSTTHELLIDSA